MHFAGPVTNERAQGLVVAKEVGAEGCCRDEPVCARFSKLHKQADLCHAGDTRLEGGADLVCKMGGNEAVDRFSLCNHRASFGR